MPLDFPKLESLRLLARQILQDQVASLRYFEHNGGYQHFKGKDKISVSSTATCVLSLIATDCWTADRKQTKTLLENLAPRETSAGLPPNNPFTLAWILEAVTALEDRSEPLEPAPIAQIEKKEQILQDALREGEGGVKIGSYPRSAYLTQLVVRALRHRSKLTEDLETAVNEWAWAQLKHELVLIHAKSKTSDPFAVAYLVMLVTAGTPRSKVTPEQSRIQKAALKTFFDCQMEDGAWPSSRPLFHYEKFGNAHCYEYEMLTQLLHERELEDLLLEYLPKLGFAAESALHSTYRVEDGALAWSSGHHPQLQGPESWATASVYHFAHKLDRLAAQSVRQQMFRHMELPFPESEARGKTKDDFAKDFLDCEVVVQGKERSVKDFLWDRLVEPLAGEVDGIASGRRFNRVTPRSAIFFGPPGTSKTELSKEIARFLGWPHLAIDPSHFLRHGMDGMQGEANMIFRMLEETERIVVLFDEFDELVRERGKAEPFSRLLTTAMLPKLASIHKRASLVFIIATNNIGEFDLAIRRPGRFDRVVQIMPPTYEAKIRKKDWGATKDVDLEGKLHALGVDVTAPIKQQIGDLTYLECDEFAAALAGVSTPQAAIRLIDDHSKTCILQSKITQDEDTTWTERCKKEVHFSR